MGYIERSADPHESPFLPSLLLHPSFQLLATLNFFLSSFFIFFRFPFSFFYLFIYLHFLVFYSLEDVILFIGIIIIITTTIIHFFQSSLGEAGLFFRIVFCLA